MPWQLLILIHSVLAGYRMTLLRRLGLHEKDITQYTSVVSYICVFLFGLLVIIIMDEPIDHAAAWEFKWFLLIGGALLAIANVLTLKLLRLVNASIAVLLTLCNTLMLVLIATLFGGENLSILQAFGCLAILTAVFLAEIVHIAQRKKTKRGNKKASIGASIGITLLISIPFALGILNEKHLLNNLSLTTYLFYGWGGQLFASICIAAMSLRGRKNHSKISSAVHKQVWLAGVLLALGGFLFVVTLNQSKSSILSTVASSSKVISAVIFAYILLHERDGMKLKFGSIALSIVGFLLLLT